ncbi:phage minor head protein [uncultured Haemophilus sp.]|uniref:phage head morphogenesis protein n=1 Tax=uncultured Haemophilus sp. TaxID=237779 RepID=UPI00280486BF|nr:phage minor head protein [uncultured Haemophilus sp.]
MLDDKNRLDMGYIRDMPPDKIVEYLKAKGVQISENWFDVWQDAHAKAFTVAKATKAEIVDTLKWSVEKALQEKMSYDDYIKMMTPICKEMGWWGKVQDEDGNIVQLGSPWRLKTILRTNKIAAYHTGRYARQMENADEQPYWQYVAIQDNRTRASHQALHGKIYRYDDPIWQHFYPPNDYGCRCRVRPWSEFALKDQGWKVDSSEGQMQEEEITVMKDELTGREVKAKVMRIKTDQGDMRTGAGWNYNVGAATVGTDIAVLRKLQKLKNSELRQQTIQAINNNEARHNAFADWVKANLGKRGASSRYISAGFVSTEIAEKVTELSEGTKMSELVLVMSEKRLQHANSNKHHKGGVGLTVDEYASISRIIANPGLVLWDKLEGHNNLIYINQEKTIQIFVDVPNDHPIKPKEKVDSVINAYKVDMDNIKRQVAGGNYVVIKGEL